MKDKKKVYVKYELEEKENVKIQGDSISKPKRRCG